MSTPPESRRPRRLPARSLFCVQPWGVLEGVPTSGTVSAGSQSVGDRSPPDQHRPSILHRGSEAFARSGRRVRPARGVGLDQLAQLGEQRGALSGRERLDRLAQAVA